MGNIKGCQQVFKKTETFVEKPESSVLCLMNRYNLCVIFGNDNNNKNNNNNNNNNKLIIIIIIKIKIIIS